MSSSGFAALCSAFGRYDVVHIHAEGPAFFAWLPKLLGKRVVVTIHGIDWQREKWQSGLGSKFIHQGEKNAAKYADEVIVLSKGVQDYFKETYGRSEKPNGSYSAVRMFVRIFPNKSIVSFIVVYRSLNRSALEFGIAGTEQYKRGGSGGGQAKSSGRHPRRDLYLWNVLPIRTH